jgi:hypothetical protein
LQSHKTVIASSRAILLACFLAVAAPASQTVEGRIINGVNGAGIAGAQIRLLPAEDSPAAQSYSTTSDAQGHFRIEAVKEGNYTPRYSAAGFAAVPDPGNSIPAFPVASGADPVRVEIKLQPLAKLSGRVTDTAGRPVPNAGVWLVKEERWCAPPTCFSDRRESKTNQNGEYTVADLTSGPWLLSATAPSVWEPPEAPNGQRLGWTQTYYPGVANPLAAETIRVGPGAELWEMNMRLAAAPVHSMRGRILDPSGNPAPKASVSLGKGYGPTLTQEARNDGGFEFPAVVDDEWRLSATMNQGAVKLRGAQTVEIRKSDLEKIELRLAAPITLRGKIVMEVPQGAPAAPEPQIDIILVSQLALLSDGGGTSIPVPAEGGVIEASNVYPGPYHIEVLTDAPDPYYLDSIRLGGQNAAGPVSILSDAEPLTLTYKAGGGAVRGTVENCSSGNVILMPREELLRSHAFIRITPCRPNGRFEFTAVRPGEYYGFASSEFPSGSIFQDEVLLKQASSVTVQANQATSADIRLIARR